METKNNRYFTSPLHKINHCNECEKPIKETDGRFHVSIDHDSYIGFMRIGGLYGYKTFCSKCFEKLFGYDNWNDSESIYKKTGGE